MNIILGRDRAQELREKFTVLELETFEHTDGMQIPAYCVITGDKIPLSAMMTLEQDTRKHEKMIQLFKAGELDQCRPLLKELRGKFGGDLDTFYDHITSLIEKQ